MASVRMCKEQLVAMVRFWREEEAATRATGDDLQYQLDRELERGAELMVDLEGAAHELIVEKQLVATLQQEIVGAKRKRVEDLEKTNQQLLSAITHLAAWANGGGVPPTPAAPLHASGASSSRGNNGL